MWRDETTTMLRYIINDLNSETYTDSRLQTSVVIAAKYVNDEVFNGQYTVSVAGSGSITPDPSDNEPFINLVVLKSACLISMGEAKIAAGQGIAIKDGSSSLDLKGVAGSKKTMMDSYCKAYNDAKLQYQISGGSNGVPGEAVLGPIKYWMNYERRVL